MADHSTAKPLEGVMENLYRQISPVPGFKPPAVDREQLYCPLPAHCSMEKIERIPQRGRVSGLTSQRGQSLARAVTAE